MGLLVSRFLDRSAARTALPAELLMSIIELVGESDSQTTFQRSQLTQQTLINLSLVNHAFREWTLPILLQTVFLDSPERLSSFRAMICDTKLTPTRPLAHRVKNLAITNVSLLQLKNGEAKDVVPVLLALAPTLERLMLDFPVRLLGADPALRKVSMDFPRVLKRLDNLKEFVSTRDELDCAGDSSVRPWAQWNNLERLAFYNPDMDEQFVDEVARIPGLTHLAVVNPCAIYEPELSTPFATVFERCPNIQKLTLVRVLERTAASGDLAPSGSWWKFVADPAMEKYMKKIAFIEVEPSAEALRTQDHFEISTKWMRGMAADGSLWNQSEGKISI